jgi:hypothetical protein
MTRSITEPSDLNVASSIVEASASAVVGTSQKTKAFSVVWQPGSTSVSFPDSIQVVLVEKYAYMTKSGS